jgi:hypothetical protein
MLKYTNIHNKYSYNGSTRETECYSDRIILFGWHSWPVCKAHRLRLRLSEVHVVVSVVGRNGDG